MLGSPHREIGREERETEGEMKVWRAGVFLGILVIVFVASDAQLVENFYGLRCQTLEATVRQVVIMKLNQTFVTVPSTLRLFFHDCFVTGCDASVMISSPNRDAEKDASDNLSLAGDGFDTIVKAKAAVEALCPNVVSCADIMAIAARDVVVLAGGPMFNVELGRRDNLQSKASLVAGNLPDPTFDVNQLNAIFQKNGLNQTDMIALSGAHTVGFSHCSRFANRIYNFSSTSRVDPTLNPTYVQQLMQSCPQNVDPTIAINMDPITPRIFDNVYYQNLINGKGLFTSDEVLFTDARTSGVVRDFAANPLDFSSAFAAAMIKLGRVGVKTGSQGQVRKDCTVFNS
ncbi:peroxidase 51 [Amborella trichopoda]|nr:peroxidase 51 [Amborella trichopoda]|eukprot:XP_006848256.2 peroxidase 51 [Amborella trichopoda]